MNLDQGNLLKLSAFDGLSEAYANSASIVRRNPKSIEARVSLFQISCINGDWDKALNQLLVINDLSDDYKDFVHTYDLLIRCERMRQFVLSGKKQPLLVGEPEEWIVFLIQALELDANNKLEDSAKLRSRAFELAPTSKFNINDDQVVDWVADADSRYGPILEVCMNGKYYWIPFNRIQSLTIEAPVDLRDLIWVPASISVAGAEEFAFIPTRYCETEKEPEDALKLSRKTDWREIGGNYYKGLGQRMLTSGEHDFPLLDIQSLKAII